MAEYGFDNWNEGGVMSKAQKSNKIAMGKATLFVERQVKVSLSKPGKGKLQTRYSSRTPTGRVGKRTVRVSRPGDPPALDMGYLMSSVQRKVIALLAIINGYVGTDAKYGLHLEKGTGKMEKRPFLMPVIRKYKKQINAFFKKANSE
jgi:hypothetical protein